MKVGGSRERIEIPNATDVFSVYVRRAQKRGLPTGSIEQVFHGLGITHDQAKQIFHTAFTRKWRNAESADRATEVALQRYREYMGKTKRQVPKH